MANIQIEMSRRKVYRWAEKAFRFEIYVALELLMLCFLLLTFICHLSGEKILIPSLALGLLFLLHFDSGFLFYPWILLRSLTCAAAVWFISSHLLAPTSSWIVAIAVFSVENFISNELKIYRRASHNFSVFKDKERRRDLAD